MTEFEKLKNSIDPHKTPDRQFYLDLLDEDNLHKYFMTTISYFINFSYVLAEETSKKENTCDYKAQAELNKIAANVTASYEIEKKEDGSNVFKISVYNITEKLFVSVLDEEEVFSLTITPAQLTNGVYTFEIANDTDVIRYNFTVRSLLEGCTGTIRKFSFSS